MMSAVRRQSQAISARLIGLEEAARKWQFRFQNLGCLISKLGVLNHLPVFRGEAERNPSRSAITPACWR